MPHILLPEIFQAYKQELGFLCSSKFDANELCSRHCEKHFGFAQHRLRDEAIPYVTELHKTVPQPIAFCGQSHQDIIYTISSPPDKGDLGGLTRTSEIFHPLADALITKEKELPLLIRTADCLSIIIFDPVNKVIANIHAGWRGQTKKIVSKTITKMQQDYNSNPKNLLVWSSPSLGFCCAEFSDPYNELPKQFWPFIHSNKHVDLKAALKDELVKAGILKEHLEINKTCTCCDSENWFSHRRNKETKRIANIVWLKK